jgi:hypothetical protein
MGRVGHASCARSMLGANAIPSDNTSPARCFIAFSLCFRNRKKQVLCRLLEFLEFQVVSRRLLQHSAKEIRSSGSDLDEGDLFQVGWNREVDDDQRGWSLHLVISSRPSVMRVKKLIRFDCMSSAYLPMPWSAAN